LEPDASLYDRAAKRLDELANVTVINSCSEEGLEQVLHGIERGEKICFFLDGHFSGDGTFKGPNDCPLNFELQLIASNLHRWCEVSIFIDDARLLGRFHAYGYYPSIFQIADYARDHGFDFKVEYDILILQKPAFEA